MSSKIPNRASILAVLTSLAVWLAVATDLLGSVQVSGELADDHSQTTQTAQARARLEPGHGIDQSLAPNETYGYETKLWAGQYLRLAVEPEDVDVVVTIFAPDGHLVLTKRSPYGAQGPVDACIVATSAGAYKTAVTATDNNAHSGRYQIRIAELRKATPRDASRAAAEEPLAQAQELQEKGTIGSRRLAIDKYSQSLSLLKRTGDRLAQAQSLEQLGSLHNDLGNNKKAVELVRQSLQMFQSVHDRKGEGLATSDLGSIESDLGNNKEALAQLTMALAIRREVSDRRGEAETLEYIGDVYEGTSETEKALENYDAALALRRQVGDLRGEAQSLDDIGVVYDDIDEEQKGLEYFRQALPIHQSLHDLWGEALTLNNFGTAYDSLGEKKRALEYFNRALPLKRATGNRRGESTTLSNMCWVEFTLGEWQSALDHCAGALAIQHESGDRLGETQTLTNLGSLYVTLGDVPDALKKLGRALALAREAGSRQWEAMVLNALGLAFYEQGDIANAIANHEMALPLRRAAGDRSGEAATLNNLGKCHDKRGEKTVAVDYFNQSLAIARNIDSRRWEAAAFGNIGWLYATQNEEKALEYFSQARPLYQGLGDRRGEASILYGMASVEAARGELSAALAHVESALTIVEALRTKVINQQLRTSYFSSVREYYEFYVDLLMRLDTNDPTKGYAATAFELSERARARNLLETLEEARADIRRGVDPALLEQERSLQQLLDGKTERQMRLFAEHNEKQTATAKKEMEELLGEYQDVEAQIRVTSPRYAALTQPQPFGLAKIQKEVLDADTVLLEYSLGSERSYLWAVTEDSVASFQLPSGAEIELLARRVYDLLTARNRRQKNEADQQRNARLKSAELECPEAALALSKIVIGPVAKLIHGKRLAIVADGALQYVPFGVLPMPDDETSGTKDPLVVDHEVVNLPSASVLGASRRDLADRKSAPKVVAVFADPVFDRGDSRVKRSGQHPARLQEVNRPTEPNASFSATSLSESHLTRSAADIGIGGEQKHLPRLVFSREEAKSILGMTPAEQGMEALDFNANRRTAISPELGQYRMIHFATHGLLDSEHPDLSGLVLSLVDEQGRSVNGFLDLEDVYNLNLSAELATLSACETGLGKEVKGEGLVGLTRGFMYAGARRVVASLWKVDDAATAELMGRFYKGMLGDRLRPSAALRQAQVEMWKQKRWSDPYFWGAFTIQGEWR